MRRQGGWGSIRRLKNTINLGMNIFCDWLQISATQRIIVWRERYLVMLKKLLILLWTKCHNTRFPLPLVHRAVCVCVRDTLNESSILFYYTHHYIQNTYSLYLAGYYWISHSISDTIVVLSILPQLCCRRCYCGWFVLLRAPRAVVK